ncbi:asparagine synthase (glutamine-hydrolyzing) [Vineibacter terrae]|uniref:asparagine synthase (glutamine-hydrolyzing) n=1 Tax=Vineibacter terrae TaxID=2586908 RepID=UPI002E36B76C|nr:asparagine synthase (glutamine-hydrolyzing) [Vineibacter terrae]HEX2887132.1 asparagine synthase (glutamine-hydrolyzing) [Vineibacter terrae]
MVGAGCVAIEPGREGLVCGIAGLLHYGTGPRPDDQAVVARMSAAMASRGPDSEGVWASDDGIALFAQRRLAIIDPGPGGWQPMSFEGGRLVANYNGEIYNYRELRSELEAAGRRFVSQSDTEVLLHLYDLHGAGMVDRLRGMYALSIWDRERRAMFFARDPFGIKPLYVADDGRTLRFASQVKALIAGGGIDTTPEPAGDIGFLLWGSVPEPFTLYRGIRALPAGHTMTVAQGQPPAVRRFHAIASVLAEAERDRPAPTGQARIDHLRDCIADTVKHHMVADVPVGMFLSAGFDSSLVAQFAAPQSAQALRSVTLGFDEYRGTDNDETTVAAQIAGHHRADHRTVWVTRAEFAAARDHLLAAMDQPTIDGTNVYFVSKATASTGLKVALSGIGGDEVFAGYPSFRQVPEMVRLVGRVGPLAALGRGFRIVSEPVLRRFTSPKYAGVLEYGGTYGGAYLLRRGLFMPWELPALVDVDYLRQGLAALDSQATLAAAIDGVRSGNGRVAALELSFYLRNQLLRDADWAGMAHSLEIRTPFVDVRFFRDLAPLIVADPPLTKAELPPLLAPPVRDMLAGRPKRGFQVPVRTWLGMPSGRDARTRGWRAWALQVLAGFRPGSDFARRAA